jgi:hypothetical protein
LTGEQNYTVTFEGAMTYAQPVPPGFWSLTMYDGVTRYSVPNPINSYSLGSSNELKRKRLIPLTQVRPYVVGAVLGVVRRLFGDCFG